ncbi:hypothetical protein FEF22_001430 [Texas Phoenix palm phytoplasma]|uniref:Effector n=1 Tax=Texas Phoenix palm phytoplasma TaxID=176709 RepID=A0ABS5BIP0_9MOLU|nr:hypothetical protein [Texas Phoenix palm phytoplasma]MBP3059206.1 hypothetical protein [Texas Phoenix palm phytoplasma]MBP3059445.1 hypothetical protein [Texas Phoenix palm phytoplasma]
MFLFVLLVNLFSLKIIFAFASFSKKTKSINEKDIELIESLRLINRLLKNKDKDKNLFFFENNYSELLEKLEKNKNLRKNLSLKEQKDFKELLEKLEKDKYIKEQRNFKITENIRSTSILTKENSDSYKDILKTLERLLEILENNEQFRKQASSIAKKEELNFLTKKENNEDLIKTSIQEEKKDFKELSEKNRKFFLVKIKNDEQTDSQDEICKNIEITSEEHKVFKRNNISKEQLKTIINNFVEKFFSYDENSKNGDILEESKILNITLESSYHNLKKTNSNNKENDCTNLRTKIIIKENYNPNLRNIYIIDFTEEQSLNSAPIPQKYNYHIFHQLNEPSEFFEITELVFHPIITRRRVNINK